MNVFARYRLIHIVGSLGDPRMSIPGAENPQKVRNIVRPQIPRFRGLYFKLLREIKGISPASGSADVAGLSGDEAEWTAMGLGKEDGSGRLKVGSERGPRRFRAYLPYPLAAKHRH